MKDVLKTRTFDLFGTKWKILFLNRSVLHKEDNSLLYGTCDTLHKVIIINCLDNKGKPFPKDEIEITLYHELLHAVFETGQYKAQSEDEPLVEFTARALKSLIKQDIL